MNKLAFWNDWSRSYRLFFIGLIIPSLVIAATAVVMELGDISIADLGSNADQLFGNRHIAFVIAPDFRNNADSFHP